MGRSAKRELEALAKRVVSCEKCPRLRAYCAEVGRKKRRAYMDWEYWTRPLPGFGDPSARLLVVGLAPAANGGTRTGRVFCGDSSGDWLIRALFDTGFANQPISVSRDDGLVLRDTFITAVVRCAPPENKPSVQEVSNCLPYLGAELKALVNLKAILVLGKVAMDGLVKSLRNEYGLELRPRPEFVHGATYDLGEGLPRLYVSYHPSRRNTQTKMMSWGKWIRTFRRIRDDLGEAGVPPPKRVFLDAPPGRS